MTPDAIIKNLKNTGMSAAQIADRIGCTVYYVNKIANGERKNPNYQIVDRLRQLHLSIKEPIS